MNPYSCCHLCPRDCGVDRLAGIRGRCGENVVLRLAAALIHRGEEPPITGTSGSGTIFISGCNLACVFCQNRQISQESMGRAVSTEEFARICLCLQESKAENINIVTGSHAVPALVTGINAAKALGLHIPVLWNSSAYEKTTTLEMLTGVVDGYMPDLKTLDPDIADRFFAAQHYPEIAIRALKFMMDYSDKVIIRHLVLPGLLDSTYTVLRWFADHAYGRAQLSVMMQYTPVQTGQGPDRYVNEEEYKTILRWIDELGIEDGFYQELLPDSSWLPDFSRYNPFSSELSTPIWHWRQSME